MARERKPADLKLLHGNPSKEPVKGQIKSATGKPLPPTDLKGDAFAEWCRVTTYLEKIGHIEMVDYAGLVVYCSAWSMYETARAALDEKGILVVGRDGGYVKNPAAQVMRDASDTMLKYGAKFGLTPKDRQNLGIHNDAGEDDDLERGLAAL